MKRIGVSEHAILRYAERVLGLDVKEVARQIRTKVSPAAELLGDCIVPIGHGCVAVVKKNNVITIKPDE